MNNEVFRISTEQADPLAIEYFINICGFHREGEKYERMLKHGLALKERLSDRIDIRAVVSSFPGTAIQGDVAVLDGTSFQCNAFAQIQGDGINQIYAYILTAGDFDLEDDAPMIDRLYADIWGTAYVDAGQALLKQFLSQTSLVLDTFGPGYYGMDVTQVGNFFQVLQGNLIDVTVTEHNLMLPVKSCAGFFVAVGEDTMLPSSDCKSCLGNQKGCAFCQATIRGKREAIRGKG